MNCWPTPQRREQLGGNALKVVHENLGAIERTVEIILEHLNTPEHYIAPPNGNV